MTSGKPAFTPEGHMKRQQCKSEEAVFCKIFDFFYHFAVSALQNFLADGFLYARFSGRQFYMHPYDEVFWRHFF